MIKINQNQARDRFFSSPHGAFGISEIPPEVFGRLNPHAQQALKDGRTVPVNPGFFQSIRGDTSTPTQGTSLLGRGRSQPGPLSQTPQEAPGFFAPQALASSADSNLSSPGLTALGPTPNAVTAPKLNQGTSKPIIDNYPGFSSSLFGKIRDYESSLAIDEYYQDLYEKYYTEEGNKRAIYDDNDELIDLAFDISAESAGFDESGLGRQEAINDLLSQAGLYGLKQSFLTSPEGVKFLAESGIGKFLDTPLSSVFGSGGSSAAAAKAGSAAAAKAGGAAAAKAGGAAAAKGGATAGSTVGSAASAIAAGLAGKTLGDIVVGGSSSSGTLGAVLGGGTAALMGTGLWGIAAGAFIGSVGGGFAGKGKKLHQGERNFGESFKNIQHQNLFQSDQNASFAKNLALARLGNPEEGDDSVGDALHEVNNRVGVNVKEGTLLGFKELIEEGHVGKRELLDNMTADLRLYRKEVEGFNDPRPALAPQPQEKNISVPDSALVEEEPQPVFAPPGASTPKPKPKPKPKKKKQPTILTSPSGLGEEPIIFTPSL